MLHESTKRVHDAYDEGYTAGMKGEGVGCNPYDELEQYYAYDAWNDGWNEAADDRLRKQERSGKGRWKKQPSG